MSFGIRSIPDDLALEALDTLTLYQALAENAPGCEALDPEVFFHSEHGPNLLVQKDIIRYEHALKRQLILLMEARAGNDGDAASNIIQDLQDSKVSSLQDANKPPSRESYRKNLIFLLSDLHVKGELVSWNILSVKHKFIQIFSLQSCSVSIARIATSWFKSFFRLLQQRKVSGERMTQSGKKRFASGTSGQSVRKSASERQSKSQNSESRATRTPLKVEESSTPGNPTLTLTSPRLSSHSPA